MLKLQRKLGLKLITGIILLNLLGTLSTAFIVNLRMNDYYKRFVYEDHLEQAFLTSVTQAIWLSFILLFILAVLVGIFLIMQITRPLRELALATEHVARREFGIRVKVQSRDELGELAKNFNTMIASLEAAENWKKQLIADIAHELRTPVSLLQGQIEMMLEGVYTPDEQNLRSLYEETKHLTRLISELQDLAFAESGKMELQLMAFDLVQLAEEVLLAFRPEAEKKRITLKLEPPTKLPQIRADKEKLYQVLCNLLTNALRYTPAEGAVTIRFSLISGKNLHFSSGADRESREYIRLIIEDTGPGIPVSELEQIFDRFYRLDKARNRQDGGSGLGLAICREIIRLHAGRIWAEHPGSSGARFCFMLPIETDI